MKVSIIIPIYNVSKYVERCLTSVLHQTYNDIECILVDDCTPDDSMVKCKSMIENYQGPISFKVLHHEKNRGLSAARNTGTESASGDYIYYLDSDDEITSNCIELMVAETIKHPDVQVVMAATESVPYKEYYNLPYYKKCMYVTDNNWVRYNFNKPWPYLQVNAWNKLISRKFIVEFSLSFKEGLVFEDQLWMFYLTKHLDKMSIITDKTYVHYCTSESIMSTTNRHKSAANIFVIVDEALRNLDTPFYDAQLFKYMYYYFDYYDVFCRERKYKRLLVKMALLLIKRKYYKFSGYFVLNCMHENWFSYSPKDIILCYWRKSLNQSAVYEV